MSTTFKEQRDKILKLAFPFRMPANLIARRQQHYVDGLIRLQELLWRLREDHTDTHIGDDIYCGGGMIVDAPLGEVVEVWADRTDPGTTDNPITACSCRQDYLLTSRQNVEQMMKEYQREGGDVPDPTTGLHVQMLPVGSTGYFAIERGRLWAFPCTLSPWKLKVKWDGIKQTFLDLDPALPLTSRQESLLVSWCEAMAEKDERNWQNHSYLMQQLAVQLSREVRQNSRMDNPRPQRKLIENPVSHWRIWASDRTCRQADTTP